MKTSYLVSRHDGAWGLYLWAEDIEILQAGLPDEATALERAIGHAKETGADKNFRILQAEINGNIKTIYDSEDANLGV
jgi:hypothetical protein